MKLPLENEFQLSSQGSVQVNVDGLTEEIIAQESRSRPPAAAGAPVVADERAPLLIGLEAKNKPRD